VYTYHRAGVAQGVAEKNTGGFSNGSVAESAVKK